MKRQNIETVLGFLDAIRRGDREAAGGFLDPAIVWRGWSPSSNARAPRKWSTPFFTSGNRASRSTA
jgi:hypothetical protein